MMEFAGSFRQFSFPDVLRSIEQAQRTGRLAITNGALRAAIYFASGQWLLAERSGPGQLLAQQFVKAGLVTPEQVEAACSVSFLQAGAIPDVQLVRALISSRTITQEQLRTWAIADAVSLLSIVLSWTDGEFIFEDGVNITPGKVALPMPVGPLLAQALRQTGGPGAAAREVAPLVPEAVVDFVEVDPDSGVAIQLTRDQWRLLTAVDGMSSLRAITRALHAPEPTILRLAGELVAQGTIMVVGHDEVWK
jgi:Domain of unknown function (DUF4388)